MPNYYNPYNFYPATYANQMGYNPMMAQTPVNPQPVQQSYGSAPQQKAMEWVEGEIGAKAFQMPAGWPANTPIPLWDSTDTVIYLKSVNQMGIPNPMQKLKYQIEEQPNVMLPAGNQQMSGAMEAKGPEAAAAPDMSQYVTKTDLDEIRQEIRNALNANAGVMAPGGNQNGSQHNGNAGADNKNRGGSR